MIGKLSKAAVTVAVVLYAVPLCAWLLARSLQGETWWAVGYMNAVGIWWFAPLALCLPVALLLRARQATIVGVALLIPFLWFYGDDFIPGGGTSAAHEAVPLKVMTFNTLVGNQEYGSVISRIQESNPDIIGTQELTPEMDAAITAALATSHPYKIANPWPDPRGIGIWSRYPLTEGENRTLEGWEWWVHTVQADIEGRVVVLYNVHLWPIGTTDPEGFRIALAAQKRQVDELIPMLEREPNPVIVMGDFNSSPTNEAYGRLTDVLEDAWGRAGWGAGFTFPARGSVSSRVPPFLRIDYLMTRGEVRPVSIEVLDRAGSDHLPVVGEFILN